MTERVTITPLGGLNTNGDPRSDGTPFDLVAWEVAPGNTLLQYGIGGDLDTVEFTVFLPLRIRAQVGADWLWQPVIDKLTDSFAVDVRGRHCIGRAQEWNSGGRGGLAILCHSATGKAE